MTSMRMRILSCVSLVDLFWYVLGRYIGGEGGGWGGDDVHANAASVLCFSCRFVFCALVGKGGWHFTLVFACVPTISGQHCADPRLVLHASLDLHVHVFDLRAGVGRGGGMGGGGAGGWGLMTSMRMRLACTASLSALWVGGEGGTGGC